jgi:ClpX C4-type zinc finger
MSVGLAMCLASRYARHMDEKLLAAARQAQEQLVEADHAAEVAKAQFHRAVRRLHLSGASLRELAAALNLSHQRVHQIVETAGGARRWGRRGRLPPDLACSFCGRRQRKTRKLVAGPDVYICEKCVEMAETVIRSGQATETALGPLHSVPDNMAQRRCSFCGKRRHQVNGLATSVGDPAGKLADDAAICSECLILCREIHSEQLA